MRQIRWRGTNIAEHNMSSVLRKLPRDRRPNSILTACARNDSDPAFKLAHPNPLGAQK